MTKILLIVCLCLVIVLLLVVLFTRKCKWASNREELRHPLLEDILNGLNKFAYLNWKCIDQEECKNVLRDVHEVFGAHSIEFWLSEGTALGVRRDNNIIPHDDDVDIVVRRSDYDATLKGPIKDLFRKGFRIAKVWNKGYFVTLVRNKIYLDIGFNEQGELGIHPAKYTLPWKRFAPNYRVDEDINGLRDVRFMNLNFRVPSDDYFVYHYGDNWTIPDASRCDRKTKK
tara:strand:- start:90 stop:773 length:684 start_codon:yes stop_codon:yes gene_type:complete